MYKYKAICWVNGRSNLKFFELSDYFTYKKSENHRRLIFNNTSYIINRVFDDYSRYLSKYDKYLFETKTSTEKVFEIYFSTEKEINVSIGRHISDEENPNYLITNYTIDHICYRNDINRHDLNFSHNKFLT